MTIDTNENFDAKNVEKDKIPLYKVDFDSEFITYVNHKTDDAGDSSQDQKKYLKRISGLAQRITPEEGKSSVGSVAFELIDKNGDITALLATDTAAYFHNRATTIKAGYVGMDDDDLLTIQSGKVTHISEKQIGTYKFDVTDLQKVMQRKLFRDSVDNNVEFSGNPLTMFLAWLTSTGNGTNGPYDYYAEENGLAIDEAEIDIVEIEKLRGDYYPGISNYMFFDIREPMVAKTFFEQQIFKVLNLYLVIKGDGRISLKPYKPNLPTTLTTPVFTKADIIGKPKWSANLEELINEVIFKSNWDADNDEFDLKQFFEEGISFGNRGSGRKTITISSKGFHSDNSPRSVPNTATEAIQRRINSIFNRYATPPNSISFTAWFSKWIAEAGDIARFSHDLIPDIVAGTRGLSNVLMEVIQRSVNWDKGNVKFRLLDTGFAKDPYQVISPTMAITSGTNSTTFEVSSDDATKYADFTNPVVDIMNSLMSRRVTAKAISDITGTTITIADMGLTPSAGWIVVFSDYDSVTAEQKKWGYIADPSNTLGTDNDPAHLIVP